MTNKPYLIPINPPQLLLWWHGQLAIFIIILKSEKEKNAHKININQSILEIE